MLTLVDKAMLVKYYYLSEELAVEALQMFQTEKKMKKRSGPITLSGLISLKRRFRRNWKFSGLASQFCTTVVRGSYL